MAKVKIQGHASGTGILTVTAPNTSTDRTITLPDATGTLLTEVADDSITLAKMASGTDGNIISYDASGNPVAIATGSDGQVLTSAGAGQPPAFEASANNTPSFSATHNDNTALTSSNSWTLVAYATEVMDNGGCYNPASGEYKFTPGVAGYYQVSSVVNWYASNGNVQSVAIALYKNGSEYIAFRSTGFQSNQADYYVGSSTYSGIISLDDDDYLQVYWNATYSSNAPALNGIGAFSATKVII